MKRIWSLIGQSLAISSVRNFFQHDAHGIISVNGRKVLAEDYNPYCPVCESCGHDGCCSALSCKQDPNGSYCESYLQDLKFGYLMYKDLYELISDDPKYSEKLEQIFDTNYDIVYGSKNNKA
jgi:hypothetical protein